LSPWSAAEPTTLEARWTSAARPTASVGSPSTVNLVDDRRRRLTFTWSTAEN
jgi:hypothetical protein